MSASPRKPGTTPPRNPLQLAAQAWFCATALGQILFAGFVVLFYYTSGLSGQFWRWNNKPLITGHVPGDDAGNRMFLVHVLCAAVMTLAGLMQMIPQIRARFAWFHRWSGRIFMASAATLAIGGLWLVWVRGSYLTISGALAISMDAVLILGFGLMAWQNARARKFAAHRRWALRLFMVASGVWFMRIGYMVWGLTSGGAGIAKGMSGPFDHFWAFATHLLPLAVLELYFLAERAKPLARYLVAGILWLAALAILGGSLAAWAVMWWPYI